MGVIKDMFSSSDEKKAGERMQAASETSADAQREALAYLKEREAVPSAMRDQALGVLGQHYGLPGVAPTQPMGGFGGGMTPEAMQRMSKYGIDPSQLPQGATMEGSPEPMMSMEQRAMASPLYRSMVDQGEQSIMRTASATGGLRSGGSIGDIGTLNQNAMNLAYQDQLSGLQGLANMPSNANAIANTMSGIGNTLAQGQAAYANAALSGSQLAGSNILGGADMALTGFDVGGFSDARLKDNVVKIGERDGHNLYQWEWNAEANELGLFGDGEGFMAHEVMEKNPELVGKMGDYLFIKGEHHESV